MGELLDLSTVHPDRPTIRIRTAENPDGALYELALASDLGIAETHGLANRIDKLSSMWDKRSDLTDKQAADLDDGLTWIAGIVIRGCPSDVVAQLSAHQRLQVARAFTDASEPTRNSNGAEADEASPQTRAS